MPHRKRRPQVTEPRNILAREREHEALEFRKAGATYRQIGKRLGISLAAAHKRVMNALAEIRTLTEAEAEDVRRLEVERMDAMLLGLWERARRGDDSAVAHALKIMQRRAALLGLDAPQQIEGNFSADVQKHMYWPENQRGPNPKEGERK